MKKLCLALSAVLLLLAAPLAADWRLTAQVATWFFQRPTADINELRSALLWHFEQSALDGLIATAARPNIAITDLGGGNSELAISMTRAQGEAWINSYAPLVCSDLGTLTSRAACVDAGIRLDLRRVLRRYRDYQNALAHPVAEPSFP